ncbi:MAG TPA: hypothetical protein VFA04_05230 [Bryobacteraceae bacterium]|nr:hypothetical protein [Bryobacteraceae bacterium]
MPRTVVLVFGVVLVFAVVSAVLLRLMPGPLTDTDYLVAGSVATGVSLLVLFLGLIGVRSSDTFFRKRKKR